MLEISGLFTNFSALDKTATAADFGKLAEMHKLYLGDCREVLDRIDEKIHLVVTSPPYNLNKDYGSCKDDLDYETEYLPMILKVFEKSYKLMEKGARFCLNIPHLQYSGSKGALPIACDITRMVLENTSFILREIVVWYKGYTTSGLTPNGSWPRPYGILLNCFYENVLIFQKPGQRDYSNMNREIIERSKIDKRKEDLTDNVWFIQPASGGEHPASFPKELPSRCIRLWSYRGDWVLDPFVGSGTTMQAAEELGRNSIGIEINEEYVSLIKEKVESNIEIEKNKNAK